MPSLFKSSRKRKQRHNPTSPLKYHGGKSYLAKWIISLFPSHTRYVEPFFGGGSVLFAKDPNNCAEYVSDLWGELTNFWTVLQRQFEEFSCLASVTPLSKRSFEEAAPFEYGIEDIDPTIYFSPIERAHRFFIRNRMSRQGLGRSYCTPTKRLRRGMNENVSAWLSAVEGLPEVHKRLQRVEIWDCDALEVISTLDSPDPFFYLDPPYLHSTRKTKDAYAVEMSSFRGHVSLLKLLATIKGKFLLSGYNSGLYRIFADHYGWDKREVKIDNKASSTKKKRIETECVWSNYSLSS